jgi:hypothetical protein
MLIPILIASLTVPGMGPGISPAALTPHRGTASPYVQIWTSRDEVLHRGDKLKVYFRTDVDGYVTVFRIDTDGRIRVLFPVGPWDDNYARGGARYQVDPRDDGYTFRVDDYPGEGYVFAIASMDPFLYTPYVRNDHWDYRMIGTDGRIAGDPYVAIDDVIGAIVPANYVDYSYDVVPYFVEEHYDYPRFLCYNCHAYAAYPYWDPYAHSCARFRIVIYDDPYYYPARTYYATRVVYPRPVVPVPRYVFKDRTPNDRYVTTVRERPVDQGGRRLIEPGATRRDLPGGGVLPTPTSPRTAPAAGADPGRRVAPGTVGEAPRPTTPTLERRDPAKAPTVPDTRRPTERTTQSPTTGGARRGTPDQVPPKTTAPPKTGTPTQAPPKTTAPTRRGEPTTPPKTVTPTRRGAPSTPPKVERSAPPPKAQPPKASPPKTDPKRGTTPPKRRG